MEEVFLGLGSNLGDRKKNIRDCVGLVEKKIGKIQSLSSLYETPAWGKEDQPAFYNMVIKIETDLIPYDLMDACKSIEWQLGRRLSEKWGPRVIDIDILIYGHEIVNKNDLVIPHKYLIYRNFVLIPLLEIEPNMVLPGSEEPLKNYLKKNEAGEIQKVKF